MVLTSLHYKPWFLRACSTSLLKTLREKEKLLITSNFSFSHSVFYPLYPSGELSAIYNQIQSSRLQTVSVWKSLKIVVWERVKVSVTKFNKFTGNHPCSPPSSIFSFFPQYFHISSKRNPAI